MFKIRKVLMAAVFVLIGFTIPVMLRIVSDNQLNLKISREFYSNHAVTFFVTDSGRNDIEYIMENMNQGDILYGEIDGYCRGVYVKGHKNKFPVIEGRGFQDTDYFADKKAALIGRNFREDCEIINGKRYYIYRNEPYEVIGILGIESPSLLDNYVWINLDAMLDTFHSDGFYVLDGGRKCGDILKDPNLIHIVSEVEAEEVGIKAMYQERNTGIIIFVLLAVCFFICASICISFWLESQKYVLSVKRLCGIPNFNILFDLLKDFIITCGLSYLCGSIVSVFLWKSSFNAPALLITLSVTMLLLLFSFIPMVLYLRNWADGLLR